MQDGTSLLLVLARELLIHLCAQALVCTEVAGQVDSEGNGVKDQCSHSALYSQGIEETGTSCYGHQGEPVPRAAGKAGGRPSLAGRHSVAQVGGDPVPLSPILL